MFQWEKQELELLKESQSFVYQYFAASGSLSSIKLLH